MHYAEFPVVQKELIDSELEERMMLAQRFTSMVLALRKKIAIKVRQPLSRIMIPVLSIDFEERLRSVEQLLLNEVNVKKLEYLDPVNTVLVKRVKPDFKALGPKFGKVMKELAKVLQELPQTEIAKWEQAGELKVTLNGETYTGCLVASEDGLTVALDYELTPELLEEGIAREFVNRIQNQRKENGYEVSDRIALTLAGAKTTLEALQHHQDYIQTQTLCERFALQDAIRNETLTVDFGDPYGEVHVAVERI